MAKLLRSAIIGTLSILSSSYLYAQYYYIDIRQNFFYLSVELSSHRLPSYILQSYLLAYVDFPNQRMAYNINAGNQKCSTSNCRSCVNEHDDFLAARGIFGISGNLISGRHFWYKLFYYIRSECTLIQMFRMCILVTLLLVYS